MTYIAGQRLDMDNILLITESPAVTDPLLRYAAKLAREYDAETHVLHTRPTEFLGRAFVHLLTSHSFERGWRDLGPGRLARELVSAGDRVAPRLHQMISDADIDLVMLGWTDRSDAQRGAVVEEVLATSNVPVLVLGPGIRDAGALRTEPATILHATDFSPQATAAAQHALSWAQEYQAWLTLLHVVEGVRPRSASEQAEIEETFRAWMSELFGNEPPVWCETEHLVRFGRPVDEIVATARDIDADMIVLGRAGLDGASHARPGSTTLKVLREAPCPVLMISGPMAKREPIFYEHDRRATVFPVAA